MKVGAEWLVDAAGCSPEVLRDLGVLEDLMWRLVADVGLTVVVGPISHRFPDPGGITVVMVLSESHLVCHTYPEHGIVSFNLYCCRHAVDWPWQSRLREALGADRVELRSISRGVELHGRVPG